MPELLLLFQSHQARYLMSANTTRQQHPVSDARATIRELSLAEEEVLDAIDPLRHLCSANASDLLPAQPASLRDQIIQITIEAPPIRPEDSHQTIIVSLAVDASPGCGGIAWPAGEVRLCNSHVACHHILHLFYRCRANSYNLRHL
jgi:hypothetical protein